MVYLDPPYGIKFGSNWQATHRQARRDGRQDRGRHARSRADQGVPRHVGSWDQFIPRLPPRSARRRPRPAHRIRSPSSSRSATRTFISCAAFWTRYSAAENFVSLIRIRARQSGQTNVSHARALCDYILWYAKDIDNRKVSASCSGPSEVGGQGADEYDQVELPDGTRRLRRLRAERQKLATGRQLPASTTSPATTLRRAKGEGAASWFTVEIDGRDVHANDTDSLEDERTGHGESPRWPIAFR